MSAPQTPKEIRYLTKLITDFRLPVNPTTAYLTPTLRNINFPLTTLPLVSAAVATDFGC